MKIKEYIKPVELEEAYQYRCNGAVMIGGGAFLNLGDRVIDKAVDLSGLGLDFIEEYEDRVEIGAMTCLRDIESSSVIQKNFQGALSQAIASIMGVQLRNMATLGGSIYGKYGFSDILTVLLALNAQAVLYKAGMMDLENFLEGDLEQDILLKVIIRKHATKAAFESIRKTSTDFSMLNCAAALVDGSIRLCVGARPARAKLAKGTMSFLNNIDATVDALETAAIMGAEELSFGNDLRASAEYRKELCKHLIKLCTMEVL